MFENRVYLLVVNYNSAKLIGRLIDSLHEHEIKDYRLVIVNNSVRDSELASFKNDLTNIIEVNRNLGFGRACNLGLDWIYRQNSRALVWLINPDTYFNSMTKSCTPTDTAIAFFANHPQISILGTTVYDAEGKLTSAGGKFVPGAAALAIIDSLPEFTGDYYLTDWTSGCSLLLNLSNFSQCPSFDPRYFLYYEDLDFCLRYGKQGHKIAVTPQIKVVHDTSSISDRNLFAKYQYITRSYLIHIEKYGSLGTFVWANIRMLLNIIRLSIFKPQRSWAKLIGFYCYWRSQQKFDLARGAGIELKRSFN